MDKISTIVPTVIAEIEASAHVTKESPLSIEELVKLPATLEAYFDPFKTFGDPALVDMKAKARAFALDLIYDRETPYWLSLLGTSGAGKTMLARIINQIFKRYKDGKIIYQSPTIEKRASGGFITWNRIVQWLRDGDYRCFDDVSRDYFVAVDDIASEYVTDFSSAKLYQMFADGEGKWRVWTGNLSLEQIADRIDPRIASRMLRSGSIVADVDTKDYSLR